jgi:hypothetical protein
MAASKGPFDDLVICFTFMGDDFWLSAFGFGQRGNIVFHGNRLCLKMLVKDGWLKH